MLIALHYRTKSDRNGNGRHGWQINRVSNGHLRPLEWIEGDGRGAMQVLTDANYAVTNGNPAHGCIVGETVTVSPAEFKSIRAITEAAR